MNNNDPKIKALSPLLRRVRRDVTAVKKADGTTAWTREGLTKELVAKHLNGGPARGVCPILEGQSVTLVGLLDFDSHGGETPWPGMVAAAREVYDTAALFGLRAVPFRSSGGRGIHLIFLWDEPQDAASVRACLADILASCGMVNGSKGVAARQVEVFPKQDSVSFGGFGNQFILPLAGKSVPLDPERDFEPQDKDAVLALRWPMSEPVPVVPGGPSRPAEAAGEGVGASVPLAALRGALAAIPNEGDAAPDYDEWRDIMFALHHATGGSAEGLELAIEFSARNPAKHNETFLRERVWRYIKHKQDGKTARTIFAKARGHGWVRNEADWFEVLDEGQDQGGEPGAAGAGAPAAVGMVGGETPPDSRLQSGGGTAPLAPKPPPPFRRDPKTGAIAVTAPHLEMAVQADEIVGGVVGYDEFRDEVMIDRSGGLGQWERFLDEDYFFMCVRLENIGFKPIGREKIRDAVHAVARKNRFDTARFWINTLTWDGTPRIDAFLHHYFGTEQSDYTKAVSAYLWTALAGRVLEPGVKCDMVPIAVGGQGVGKSTGIAAIAPDVEFFCEISFHESEEDLARKMRGKLVAEIGELRGLHTKEIESIKAFATRTHEQWVPKFKEFSTNYPRRCVLFGSTNQDQFLADQTGNRRWLPFDAAALHPVRVAEIAADRDQLWAEARERFMAGGVEWQAAGWLAADVHAKYEMVDQWSERIASWLDTPGFGGSEKPCEKECLTTLEILSGALSIESKHVSRKEEMRLGGVMRHLGYARSRRRQGSGRIYVWEKIAGK